MAAIERLASAGAKRISIGTALVRDRAFAREAARTYGDLLVADVAAKEGIVRVNGWREGAGIMADEIRKEAGTIKTGPGASREDARYATPEEKQIVMDAAADRGRFRRHCHAGRPAPAGSAR